MDEKKLQDNFDGLTLGDRHKIIVGVDYGTTFSGVSYVTTDKNDIDDINVISTWPGQATTSWKTPTRIAYRKENPSLYRNKWGFEADRDPKLISYSWTKLLLDKHAEAGDYDDPALATMSGQGLMQLPAFRGAPGVCEDFLHEMYEYVSNKLRQQMTATTYDMTPMECWITLPAIWSDQAKSATIKAAKNAGFGSRPLDEVFTIAEPEAAAVATLSRYSAMNTINAVKPGEHVLICDCGGGTVDITTYTVTAISPSLEFQELCVGIGGKCGSTYIDRNLHTLLSKRFGNAFDRIPHAKKAPGSPFMTCFEMLKRDFGLNDDYGIREVTPLDLGIPDSEYYDDDERMVKLTYWDMESLFEPVISEIIKLVGQQATSAKGKTGKAIDRVILVGGFGDSPYLNQVLRKWCQANGNIRLMCPEHPQAAVVRGAALRGLQGIVPHLKKSRRHYGFTWGLPFREGIDDEKDSYIEEFTDKKHCANRMSWVIAKGEDVFKDTHRSVDCLQVYTPGQPLTDYMMLYSSVLDEPQENISNARVEKVGKVVSSFPKDFDFGETNETYNARLGKKIYQFRYTVQARFGEKDGILCFRTLVNGKVVGTTDIEYSRH
jgi:molecular chaperone DnaK (HSP70)